MKDKRLQIIETALSCFARKGFHATSIQEIADTLGIAKGSLYFYFKSKEDLLLSAFRYHYEKMRNKTLAAGDEPHFTPKQRFTRQLEVQIQQFLENRHFIMMLFNEQNLQINDEMKAFFTSVRAQSLYWHYQNVVAIYGEESSPYAVDAAAMIMSISGEYMGFILLQDQELDSRELAEFLISRLDDLMDGMLRKKGKPLLTPEQMGDWLEQGRSSMQNQENAAFELVYRLRESIENSKLEASRKEEIRSSLFVIEGELRKDEPQMIVIKGMLSFLKGSKVKEIRNQVEELIQVLIPDGMI